MSDAAATVAEPNSFFRRISVPGFRRKAEDGGTTTSSGGGWWRRVNPGSARWISLVILALFMALRIWDPGPMELLRLKTFDFYQQIKPRAIPANTQVAIVDLDDKSLEAIGQWPWPRTVVAEMVRRLAVGGATAVGFDIVFPEEDRLSGKNIAATLGGIDPETRAKLAKLPSNDAVLGQMIRATKRVVVGQAGLNKARTYKDRRQLPSRVAERSLRGSPKPQNWVAGFPGLLRNVDEIERFAAGHGILSLVPEPDGIVRRVPAFFRFGEPGKQRLYPTLSIEMMRKHFGRSSVVTIGGPAGIQQVRLDRKVTVPTDRNGLMWPYFSKTDKAKYLPAVDILNGPVTKTKIGKIDASRVRGKMIIVGTSAVGLLDIKTIPTERTIPGVEVHAQLIESVLDQSFLIRPPFADSVEMAIALIGGLAIIVLVPWIGAKWTLAFFVVIAGGAGATSWYMFDNFRLMFDAGFAVAAILTLYVTLTYTSYASEEAQRRQTRDAFGKYLSPAMVKQVVEDPNLLTLGGAKRDMTILFCDVRGFTSISELFDAEGLTVLINKLLTPLTDIILAREGTVDKYMGDCIMAFWNAPMDDFNHSYDGCRAAIEMVEAMAPLNDRLEQEAKEEGRDHLPLKVGLGLNSGEAVVGNMGTAQRMDYSVLGDTVNTAARLEGQSKTYGVDIVLGPNTYAAVPELATIELDLIQVKGKTVGLQIYALMGTEEMAQDPKFIELKETIQSMIGAYRGQDWETAKKLLATLRVIGEPYKLEILCELYEARIAAYEIEPPPADWDGIFIATTK